MNRKEIIEKYNNSNDVLIGLSSLVLHKIIRKCDEVEVSNNIKEYDIIDGIKCMKLEDCLNYFDIIGDKKYYKKLKLYLDCLDNYKYERELKKEGYKLIGGVDEVGRGPLVGPVVAACVILPNEFNLDGLTDSKKLSEEKRNYFFEEIKKQSISYGIGIIDEKKIDEVNIY